MTAPGNGKGPKSPALKTKSYDLVFSLRGDTSSNDRLIVGRQTDLILVILNANDLAQASANDPTGSSKSMIRIQDPVID